MSPTVAVVIPNLNNGQYLRRALDAAWGQTVRPTEVIVVDGWSTDGSEKIIDGMTGTRWVLSAPRGQADARNVGISATACDYIVPLDADDWIEPTFIERSLAAMTPGVGVVATGLVWPDGRVQWPVEPFTPAAFLTGNRLFCCSMFRRQAWDQVGGYVPGPLYEDWLLWASISILGWKIACVHEPLFHYCPHPGGSTAKMAGRDAEYRDRTLQMLYQFRDDWSARMEARTTRRIITPAWMDV